MAVIDQVGTAAPAVDLTTELVGLRMPNPVMTASGCAAAGRELDQFFDVAQLGAVVTKSIMRDPRSGRPTPRMAETASGMLNSIGLQGPGIGSFLATDLPWLVARGARAVVSIAGGTTDEFVELARRNRVERSRRLIEEEDVGIVQERPSEGEALLHAAAERAHAVVAALGKSESGEKRMHLVIQPSAGYAVQPTEEQQILGGA